MVRYATPAFPEWHTTYWIFSFHKYGDVNSAVRIKGQYPRARYMNFVLYNWASGNMVENGELRDIDIEPAEGSQNPFVPGADRDAPREYEIFIVEEGSPLQNEPNTLVIPDSIENTAVFLRVYLPDQGMDATGGVGLPTIEGIDVSSRDFEQSPPIACPAEETEATQGIQIQGFTAEQDIPSTYIESIYPGGVGLFPNGTNPYNVAYLLSSHVNKVAVVRFLAPTYPETEGVFTGREDVRYWSVCLCGLIGTNTSNCLADREMSIDEDGWVKIVVGPRRVSGKAGWNFLPWGYHQQPMLMYRQIEPRVDFEGSIKKVPMITPYVAEYVIEDWDEERPEGGDPGESNVWHYIAASEYNIGSYGIQGKYCSISEFNSNRCGF